MATTCRSDAESSMTSMRLPMCDDPLEESHLVFFRRGGGRSWNAQVLELLHHGKIRGHRPLPLPRIERRPGVAIELAAERVQAAHDMLLDLAHAVLELHRDQ